MPGRMILTSRNLSCWAAAAVWLLLSTAYAQDLTARLESAIKAAKVPRLGISVIEADSGKTVFQHNSSAALEPASVMKLATSATALRVLGPEYKFETALFYDELRNGMAPKLYLRGGGDPHLTNEVLWLLACAIRRRGVARIGTLVLDSSHFSGVVARSGQRAYEAGSSALSLNFNSVAIEVCPTVPGKAAQVGINPEEAGMRWSGQVMTTKGRAGRFYVNESGSGEPGADPVYRLRGSIGAAQECVVQYRAVSNPPSYLGRVLGGYLTQAGVKIEHGLEEGRVPSGAKRLFTHWSRPLSQSLEDLNQYSSNFMAEQIVSAVGRTPGGQGDRANGLALIAAYLRNLGFADSEFKLADGSGLSHENRLSARMFTAILHEMQRDQELRPEFEVSLSVAGRNGTLQRRRFEPKGLILRAKTGTLDGVSSLAGYLFDRTGKKLAFAILQNGAPSKKKAMRLEERVVKELYFRAK
jgi:serine-type D-Ala-D-Ala carboxypeptidase/endopeptidase (penicillin-binding protein 4)